MFMMSNIASRGGGIEKGRLRGRSKGERRAQPGCESQNVGEADSSRSYPITRKMPVDDGRDSGPHTCNED